MDAPSMPSEPRTKRSLLYVGIGLALLVAGLVFVAGQAEAGHREGDATIGWVVQPDWVPTSDPGEDGGWDVSHNTNDTEGVDQAPDGIPVSANDQSYPAEGWQLVGLNYNVSDDVTIDRFRFVFVDDLTEPASNQERVEYLYRVNDAQTGHAEDPSPQDRDVFLANQTSADDGIPIAGYQNTTGQNGCEGTSNPPDLTGNQICWFFVRTDGDLDTSTSYFLQSEIDTSSDNARKPHNNLQSGDNQDIDVSEAADSIQSLSLTDTVSGTDQTTIETDETTGLELILGDGNPETEAWVCIYRDDDPADPYAPDDENKDFGSDFHHDNQTEAAWDDEPDCDFRDFPTHDSGQDEDHYPARQFRPGGADDRRIYNFTISDLEETKAGDLIDEFDFRVILRDEHGNVIIDDDRSDEDGNVGTDPVKIAEYNIGSDLVTVPDDDVDTFEEREGCAPVGDDNTEQEPCLRQLELTPDDEGEYSTIEIPIHVENLGNAEDDAVVSIERVDGQASWDRTLVGPEGATGNEITVSDLREPTTPSDTPTETVTVQFQPDDQAVGGESLTLRVSAESGRATIASPEDLFLKAHINETIRGGFTWDEGGTTVERATEPDRTVRADATLENTGNGRTTYEFAIDEDRTDEITIDGSSEPVCWLDDEISGESFGREDVISVRFREDGTSQDSVTLDPATDTTLEAVLDVGENVPRTEASLHRCAFAFLDADTDEDEPITLSTNLPNFDVDVEGLSALRLWEVTGDRDDERDVTARSVQETVSPDAEHHDVRLYIENIGNVSADPELTIQEEENELGLEGSWEGLDTTNETGFARSIATDSFTLDTSQGSDPAEIGEMTFGDNIEGPQYWQCTLVDGDGDGEDRRICELGFRYDITSPNAVPGDHVEFDFAWEDPNQGVSANATVELDFAFVGDVEVTSISEPVVASDDQETTIEYEATLEDGHEFNDTVESRLSLSSDDASCDYDDNPVTPTSSTLQSASFSIDLDLDPYCPGLEADDTVEATLEVEDEDGTALRMQKPANIRVVGSSPTPSTPSSQPRNFDLFPNDKMQANGTQFTRMTFEPSDGSWETTGQDELDEAEGIVLSRSDEGRDLAPYTRCSLDGVATSTAGDAPQWTRIAPGTADRVELDDDDRIPADEDDLHGVVVRESSDEAVNVGDVALYGWGDGSDAIEWTEGWNPIVLRLADANGNPAQGPAGSNTPEIELTMKFAIRNADSPDQNITHTFELSTEDDAIPIEPLGQGYYRAGVYLPDRLSDLSGYLQDEFGDTYTPELADHPMEDSADAEYEAWSLRAEIDSGDSTAGQELSGDAYWRGDQIGLITDSDGPDALNGTVGDNLIQDGGDSVERFETDADPTEDPHETDRTFVHTSLRFLGGPAGVEDWVTGPGTHQTGVFLLEESDDGQDNTETIDDEETGEPYHEHTYQPVQDATGTLEAEDLNRGQVDRLVSINSNPDVEGLYEGLLQIPDTGANATWIADLSMRDGQGDRVTPPGDLVFFFEVDGERSAASNGLPMPLCIRPPNDTMREDDVANGAGDFVLDTTRDEVTLDTRAIPGLTPDRLNFALTPVLQQDGGDGVRLLDNNDELYTGSTFHIQAPGLVSIDDGLLVDETESSRDYRVRVPVDDPSVVGQIDAWLEAEDGSTLSGPIELTDPDSDDTYSGDLPLTSSDEGNHTLVIEATDASGGVTLIEHSLSVVPNTAPQISVLSPTGDTPAMPAEGTISFAVDDGSVDLLSESQVRGGITVERATGEADLEGEELAADNVSIDGIDSRVEAGASETITVNVTEDDGSPATGTVYVNVSEEEQFNDTLSEGEASGTVTFGDEAGTETLTVEVGGSGAQPSASFDVDVVSTSASGFSSVPDSQLEYTFDGSTVEIDYAPDVGDDVAEVTARLTANLTNEPEVSRDVTVSIDNEAPTLTVQIDEETPSAGSTAVGPSSIVSASANDELTGVASLSIEGFRDGDPLQSQTVTSSTAQATIEELGLTEDGTGSVLVVVEDAAGNEEQTNLTVTVDTTAPTIDEPQVEVSGSSLVVSVDASDDNGLSGARLFTSSPGDTTFSDQAMDEVGPGSFEAQVDDPGSSGTFEYFVRVSDQVGNQANEGSRNTPLTFDLDSVDLTNVPPDVEITSPEDGAVVSGTIDVGFSLDDTEGDQVSVNTVSIEHAGGTETVAGDLLGTALEVPANETVPVDTTELANGPATLVVEAGDGEDATEVSISIEIDNPTETQGCQETVDLDEDTEASFDDLDGARLCVQTDPAEGATGVRIQVMQGDTPILDETRSLSEDGVYSLPELAAGDYDITVTQFEETDDGEQREVSTSSASLSLSPPEPVGRLVATLVLGVAVLGTTAYAAFGRWS